jgi:hypothetical protein
MPNMTHKQYADSLRQIADWYESHAEIPLPHDANEFGLFTIHTLDGMETLARAFGACEKDYTEGFFKLKKGFGEIVFTAYASRDQICKRKVVGTREVPETIIPARTEEIVEWECFDTPLLKSETKLLPEPIDIDAPLAQVIRHDQQVERDATDDQF